MGAQKALVVGWAFGQQKNYVCMCVSGSVSSGSCRSFTFLSLHLQKRIIPATET